MNESTSQKPAITSRYTESLFFPVRKTDRGDEAIERSEATYSNLQAWAGWTALKSRGIDARAEIMDVIPRNGPQGPRAIVITLEPHPFVGGSNHVMPYTEFEQALKWAQDPSRAQMPTVEPTSLRSILRLEP